MTSRPDPRVIVRDEHGKLGTTVPVKLALDIYEVEERVQFDTTKRKDALQRVRALVQAHLNLPAEDDASRAR